MYFLSFLIIFFFLLRRFIGRRDSLIFTFLAATIPQFCHFATIGYTDFILTYYYSIGMILLYLWMLRNDVRSLALAGIFTAFAVFTKNEGIVLCLVTFITLSIFIFKDLRKRGYKLLRHAAFFILIIVLLCGPWFTVKLSAGLDSDVFRFKEMSPERIGAISHNLNRVPRILYEFQKQFFGPKKWNIIWIIFLALLVLNLKVSFSGDLKYITLPILLILFFYGSVYLIIPTQDPINWYLGSTLSRLFIHLVPLAVFWTAIICREREFL